MAEGGVFSGVAAEEDMLCCSVCMEEYEDPRALPCLHTFCHKCLVQLDSSFTVPGQDVLKCPLCTEEHPIPKDKGVAGFRKDFRINTLIDQQKMKSIDSIPNRSISQEDTNQCVNLDECSHHPNELLLYHCSSPSCQQDICEKCWSTNHDSHSVKLLSKKVNDAKDQVHKQMVQSIDQINSQIDYLISRKEYLSEQYSEAQLIVKVRFMDMQEKLTNVFQQTCQDLDMTKELQEKKMSDELQSLCALQDTFIQLKDGLEKENLPNTTRVFHKYTLMYEKMHQLTADLTQWDLTCTTVKASELPPENHFDELIQQTLAVTYKDENLGANSGDVKENLIDKEKADEKPEDVKKESVDVKEEDVKTPESRVEKSYELPKHHKEKPSVWALQKGVDVFSGVQKGFRLFQGVHKELIKGIQKGFLAGANKPVRKAHSKTDVLQLRWKGFIVRQKANINCITFSKNGILFVAANNQMSCYNTLISPPAKMGKDELVETGYMNAIAVSSNATNDADIFVTLNSKGNTATFYSLKGKSCPSDPPSLRIPTHKRTCRLMASSGQFVCYPYNKGRKLYVALYAVEEEGRAVSYEEIQIPLKSARVRSVCMYVSEKGKPIVLCASTFNPARLDKADVAVVALTSEEVLWEVTFDGLDPNVSDFDLRGIACDKDNVFVLNSLSNAVYNVCKSGKSVRTLSLLDTSPNFHFTAPSHICIDTDSKSLYIAHDRGVISKFAYA